MTSSSSRRPTVRVATALVFTAIVAALLIASCGKDTKASGPSESVATTKITLITHDSFAVSDGIFEEFRKQTGIEVEVMRSGDAVEMVNQAILTNGNPQGDVLFGIDGNLLTRAFDEGLFNPYRSPGLDRVDQEFQVDPDHRVTPIDFGDVCINADREWFAEKGLAVPKSLEDLADPAYKGLLVVQDPASSTPGLAFMFATISKFGDEPGSGSSPWLDYWQRLRDNDVAVTSGWEQAYYERFSGGSGTGDRPLVVSYATSPVAEVEDPTISPADAPTEAIGATCFRQIEFAGILNGTKNQAAAQKLIDFLLSPTFQNDIPGQMYVLPVTNDATVPEAFARFAVTVDNPLSLTPETIAMNRDEWLKQWSKTMGR